MAPLYWGFGGVDGPDRAGQMPLNALEVIELVASFFGHQFLEAAAGEGGVSRMQKRSAWWYSPSPSQANTTILLPDPFSGFHGLDQGIPLNWR